MRDVLIFIFVGINMLESQGATGIIHFLQFILLIGVIVMLGNIRGHQLKTCSSEVDNCGPCDRRKQTFVYISDLFTLKSNFRST